MVAQGLDGPMATGVRTLLRAFAGEQCLTGLAAMDSQGSIQWTFSGVGINQRTVNESAVVVKFLNEQVLFSPHP
jgi:hypothetical protein